MPRTFKGRVTKFNRVGGAGEVELSSGEVLSFSADDIFSIGDKVAVSVEGNAVQSIKRLGTGRGDMTLHKSSTSYWKRGQKYQ
ncbi:hypothetical protein HYS48_02260 [Candidatus Woesearchaeota archaeon]|nr:hypothetical protein [Candidatus Woesearchaeota archaeon]